MPVLWNRRILLKILPNNRQILRVLDRNRGLLREQEVPALELFRHHVDDFEAKHVEGVLSSGARFPAGLNAILK